MAQSRADGFDLVRLGTGGACAVIVIMLGRIWQGIVQLNDPLLIASVAILSITSGALIITGMMRMNRARTKSSDGELPPGIELAHLSGAFYGILVGILALLVMY